MFQALLSGIGGAAAGIGFVSASGMTAAGMVGVVLTLVLPQVQSERVLEH